MIKKFLIHTRARLLFPSFFSKIISPLYSLVYLWSDEEVLAVAVRALMVTVPVELCTDTGGQMN